MLYKPWDVFMAEIFRLFLPRLPSAEISDPFRVKIKYRILIVFLHLNTRLEAENDQKPE